MNDYEKRLKRLEAEMCLPLNDAEKKAFARIEWKANEKQRKERNVQKPTSWPRLTPVRKTGKSRFEGKVIGEYVTLAGHHGYVVEVDPSPSCSEVVHVYRDEYLEPREPVSERALPVITIGERRLKPRGDVARGLVEGTLNGAEPS